MFLYCFFLFSFYDISGLFPVPNCNAEYCRLLSIMDCRGELEDQRRFTENFKNYMLKKMKRKHFFIISNIIMKGKNCYEKNGSLSTFEYNEALPIPLVMTQTKKLYESDYLVPDCYKMYFSFIFLFNMTDINNNSNRIINDLVAHENENRAYKRFFIIQSFEKPNYFYNSLDFVYFVPSFKDLNIEEVFNKICDMNTEDNSLLYTRRSYIEADYRIVNKLAKVSFNDAHCYCVKNYGMNLLSLESFDEFVDLIHYVNISSITNGSIGVNLYLSLYRFHVDVIWASGNPFIFTCPSVISSNIPKCFVLNLLTFQDTILFHEKNLYNLGKYIIEIDCVQPLKHSLVICEGKNNISKINIQQFISKEKISVDRFYVYFINIDVIVKILNYFSITSVTYECNSTHPKTIHLLEKYLCKQYVKTKSYHELNSTRKPFTNLFIKEAKRQGELYTFELCTQCQTNLRMKTDEDYFNLNDDNFCVDNENNKTFKCPIRNDNVEYSPEYFQGENEENQISLKCIKDRHRNCENSNLQNCEQFICPEPFIKCYNSYCILPEHINNVNRDCPHGEDEINSFPLDGVNDYDECKGKIEFVIRDVCLQPQVVRYLKRILGNKTQFLCEKSCPKNFKCVSSKIEEYFLNNSNSIIKVNYFEIQLSQFVFLYSDSHYIIDILSKHISIIISFKGQKCNLKAFDCKFQFCEFYELIILDISYNEITHSDYLTHVEHFLQLQFLNLSHNENLVVDTSFVFPPSLQIIDLSYTKIQALRKDIFGKLLQLRHLNLSHTLITQFESMGLPEYFTLDTLYIENLKIQNINKNLFRGLTVKYELMASFYVLCCPQILNRNISVSKCHAPVDLISSCKHLVGDIFKTIVIWIIGFLTLVGNGIVLVYRIGWDRTIFKKAYGLFITGLAISDFIMGVYLMIIAAVDVYYKDDYVLDDLNWRKGVLCNLSGFLSTLSSETSTFFISLITLDRYLCITYPFGEHRFSKTSKLLSFSLVWFLGFVLALIPVVLSDWEIYSSNGLCLALPLSRKENNGWMLTFIIFVGLNFILFLCIAFGQLAMFLNLMKAKKSIPSIRRSTKRRSEELSVAKNLAFVALTDFCCWFPIGILGFLSFNGYIFNREVYAWIAVFVLPINSALNPIIYTIPAVYGKCVS